LPEFRQGCPELNASIEAFVSQPQAAAEEGVGIQTTSQTASAEMLSMVVIGARHQLNMKPPVPETLQQSGT
jgi:hypothetical protein